MIRVLLFAEVDLNLIDGSSIWLASLAELLSDSPEIHVTILLRTSLTRDVVVRQIKGRKNVALLNPWERGKKDRTFSNILSVSGMQRLQADTAAALIKQLEHQRHFDVIIIRSIDTAYALINSPQIASHMWVYMTDPMRHTAESDKAKLELIFQGCKRFLCQTQEAKSAFMRILDTDKDDRITILPPMIPKVSSQTDYRVDSVSPRLGYSGKFSPPYMIREMLDAFEKIRERIPEAEFHVVGDKFHNSPPVHNFIEDVTRRLQKTSGVIWHGGVSRAEANHIMASVHVASSWRDKSFDDSVEMSTKILEYSALGIPVLMNPSTVQYRIFGADYPAYVESEKELVEKFIELISSPTLYAKVSKRVQETVKQFTFESILNQLMPLIIADGMTVTTEGELKILFVGHDFKFLRPIIAHYQRNPKYQVLTDEYIGHVICDKTRSEELLKQADIIFCEWCLGNAEWYSNNKRQDQILIIRLHHQEINENLPYLTGINWSNVDHIIFICPRNMDLFLQRFPFMSERALLLYNVVDCNSFDLPKLPGAEFNLALVGAAPKRKAPHLAFDLLERLKRIDSRYTLFIKGNHAWQHDWLWARPEEQEYYERFYSKVNASEHANSVVFDPPGNDMPEWFSKIGFLLSTSDHEGSHQVVAEAMASGAIPIIRNWAGADLLYPKRFVFETVGHAVELLFKWHKSENYSTESEAVKKTARSHFDQQLILTKYDQLLSGLLHKDQP
jgi:glycosyltransferase involved in cell wall biosynthesis